MVSAIALVDIDNKVLIAQRPKNKFMESFWEFPGGKIEAGETPEDCALRELKEETGLSLEKTDVCGRIGPYNYDYPDRCVCLFVVLVRQDASTENDSRHWVQLPSKFDQGDWESKVPEANLDIFKDLIDWVNTNELN